MFFSAPLCLDVCLLGLISCLVLASGQKNQTKQDYFSAYRHRLLYLQKNLFLCINEGKKSQKYQLSLLSERKLVVFMKYARSRRFSRKEKKGLLVEDNSKRKTKSTCLFAICIFNIQLLVVNERTKINTI